VAIYYGRVPYCQTVHLQLVEGGRQRDGLGGRSRIFSFNLDAYALDLHSSTRVGMGVEAKKTCTASKHRVFLCSLRPWCLEWNDRGDLPDPCQLPPSRIPVSPVQNAPTQTAISSLRLVPPFIFITGASLDTDTHAPSFGVLLFRKVLFCRCHRSFFDAASFLPSLSYPALSSRSFISQARRLCLKESRSA